MAIQVVKCGGLHAGCLWRVGKVEARCMQERLRVSQYPSLELASPMLRGCLAHHAFPLMTIHRCFL